MLCFFRPGLPHQRGNHAAVMSGGGLWDDSEDSEGPCSTVWPPPPAVLTGDERTITTNCCTQKNSEVTSREFCEGYKFSKVKTEFMDLKQKFFWTFCWIWTFFGHRRPLSLFSCLVFKDYTLTRWIKSENMLEFVCQKKRKKGFCYSTNRSH